MRIGIITLPLWRNYGGLLQNYALQQTLLRLGHIPLTLDLLPPKKRIRHFIWCLLHFRKPDKWFLTRSRPKLVNRFIHQHIAKTHRIRKYRETMVSLYKFDALIAGSDQIWRPKYNSYLGDMFFKFTEKLPVKKIVYGASFGTDEWEYSPQMTEDCRTLVRRIAAVSVREKSGIALCRHYFSIEAQWVLDPTLLLEPTDYEKLCTSILHSEQVFLAAYMLDIDKQLTAEIEKIGKSLNLPIRLFSGDQNASLTVEEWLAMFRDAKYVITDSFHGTVFSIIFNKPFVVIGNRARGMGRFLSLLEQFGLEDRMSPDISAEILLRPIPWAKVNFYKTQWKKQSLQYLRTVLDQKS